MSFEKFHSKQLEYVTKNLIRILSSKILLEFLLEF